MSWWYNLKHGTVESDDSDTPNTDRLGPYGSKEEAESALARIHERERGKQAEDDAWENG